MRKNEEKITQYGEWWEYKLPFKHFRAYNVLSSDLYSKLSKHFLSKLHNTVGNKKSDGNFTKKYSNYDALSLLINEENASLFEPFFTEKWLKSFSKFLSIPYIPRIQGALHSSPVNSRTGWIHTDYCSVWFDENVQHKSNILFADIAGCDYFTGQVYEKSALPKQYYRVATLIYYLCNDNWKSGDGGETGLYGASIDSTNNSFTLVEPINNSLLLFKCSPHSYHRFITNPGKMRNSIILWLHATPIVANSSWLL